MRTPFQLVTDRLSGDTLQCLEELKEQAEKGEVLGMAFVAMVKGATIHQECGRRMFAQPALHPRSGCGAG